MRAGRALVWAMLALAVPASAQERTASVPAPKVSTSEDTAPRLDELRQTATALSDANESVRAQAFAGLRTLDADALPAVRARIAELRSAGFDVDGALSGMSEFRRVQGVEAPDGKVDLAEGVLPALRAKRDRGTVLAAELVAYLRALEAQKSPLAGQVIVGELFALDAKLFKYEAPRTRERLSVLLLPALIRHRTHPKPSVRRFCEDSLLELRIESPGRAVQQDDVTLLAAILEAYGDTLGFDAMPVVVSYLGDERVAVREAALRAVRRFGKNAIWQLRERYLNSTGNEADPNWGWQRTLDEIVRLHEGPKREAFAAQLAAAEKAVAAGDVVSAEKALDKALGEHPRNDQGKRVARVYAALGAAYLDEDAVQPALRAYRRALRLDAASEQADAVRARVLYLEAEQRLAQGTVDMKAYERALELDPTFQAAEAALDELSGARAERELWMRRYLGMGAAALLALAGLFLLRRPRPRVEEPSEAPDDALEPS